jgi:hypothetical protein
MSEEKGFYSAGTTPTIARTIAENTIAYRPSLRAVGSSVTGTILLQQIAYRWYKNGEKPFYKFMEPCEHVDYRKDDSWAEELAFSYSEIQTALSKFAAKVESGTKKKDLSEQYSVIYWTDADRVTWWQFNPETFERIYKSQLLGKSEKVTYPINQNSEDTLNELSRDSTKELITGKKKIDKTKATLPAGSSLDDRSILADWYLLDMDRIRRNNLMTRDYPVHDNYDGTAGKYIPVRVLSLNSCIVSEMKKG